MKNIKIVTIITGMFAIMISFQNCSDVAFDETEDTLTVQELSGPGGQDMGGDAGDGANTAAGNEDPTADRSPDSNSSGDTDTTGDGTGGMSGTDGGSTDPAGPGDEDNPTGTGDGGDMNDPDPTGTSGGSGSGDGTGDGSGSDSGGMDPGNTGGGSSDSSGGGSAGSDSGDHSGNPGQCPKKGDDDSSSDDNSSDDSSDDNSSDDNSGRKFSNTFTCIIDGPGRSQKIGMRRTMASIEGQTSIKMAVCMSRNACENIISEIFTQKALGNCPHRNPHVMHLSDDEVQSKVDELK